MDHATDNLTARTAALHAAWKRASAASSSFIDAEGSFKPLPFDTLVPGFGGMHYSFGLGREEIVADIRRGCEGGLDAIRRSFAAHERTSEETDAAVRLVEAKRDAAIEGVNAFFDREEQRRAESPLGIAERAFNAAVDAEEKAWADLVAYRCKSPAERRAKAAYAATCDRTLEVGLMAEDAVALAA